MKVSVLREMTPDEIRRKLGEFTASYVLDWETWLQATDAKRVSTFASILRSWQATRPLPMRRPRAEASHEPPHIEDLLEEASQNLEALGDLNVSGLALASSDQINALHGLWATFLKLPQRGTASCVGITKAIMLLTNGRIGPAFDSIVRKKLGLKDHLKSSEEWVGVLYGISEDIVAFEKLHGNLTDIVPAQLAKYHVGRLYDMVLGPGTDATDSRDDSIRKRESITGEGIGKVNIREKLALFHDHWSPKIVGELNGQHVKLVKFQGEFVWHKHDHEDELFLVIKGMFRMEYRDSYVWLEEGEFLIVPRGMEHRPVAEEEVHVLLFEPVGTLNTGEVKNQQTVEDPQSI